MHLFSIIIKYIRQKQLTNNIIIYEIDICSVRYSSSLKYMQSIRYTINMIYHKYTNCSVGIFHSRFSLYIFENKIQAQGKYLTVKQHNLYLLTIYSIFLNVIMPLKYRKKCVYHSPCVSKASGH